MADLSITRKNTAGDYCTENTIVVRGAECVDSELIKDLFFACKGNKPAYGIRATQHFQSKEDPSVNMRKVIYTSITPSALKSAVSEGCGAWVIQPFDEIDIPLTTGGKITVVCGYVDEHIARFVFKECFDKEIMSENKKPGYYESTGRKHVLEEIYPCISDEWKEVIRPRKFKEIVNGEKIEYFDHLWLLSTTDVFGGQFAPNKDGVHLPIFRENSNRIKGFADGDASAWWLRTVHETETSDFYFVTAAGENSHIRCCSCKLSFVPGFDV